MARSLWKGAISFGLVHIPVEMYPATRESSLDLTMLDKRDFSPIGFKRYNTSTQAEVAWENIVKGYEYTSGEYVVLSDEDLKRANVEATQTIDILAFVNADEVPLLYHNQPYYLAPGKGGDKVYALLRETLRSAGKIGIANVVIRVKQHLAALVCVGDVIVMETLRYADEIRPADELKIPKQGEKNAAISDKELKMALALVEGMSEEWKPEQYHDTYREDVLALVEEKIAHNETKTITMPGKEREKPAAGNVIDLVALLQQSIGAKPGAKPAKGSARKAANDEPEEEEDEEEAAPAPKKRATAPRSTAAKAAAPRQRAAAAAKPKAVSRTSAKVPSKAKKTA
jgi:DNA end-binding protein Ku